MRLVPGWGRAFSHRYGGQDLFLTGDLGERTHFFRPISWTDWDVQYQFGRKALFWSVVNEGGVNLFSGFKNSGGGRSTFLGASKIPRPDACSSAFRTICFEFLISKFYTLFRRDLWTVSFFLDVNYKSNIEFWVTPYIKLFFDWLK